MPDTAAQQLLVSVDDWSAAWSGVAVSTKAPLFLARLQYPFNLVPNGGTITVWNAVSTRFPAVCTPTWPRHHVACRLL